MAQQAADAAAKMAADAKKEADAMVAAAQKEAATQTAKAGDAIAKAQAEAKAKVDAAAAAQKKAEADAAKAMADAEAAKVAAAKQAAEMQAKYGAELEVLKSGVAALKKVVDQNAALLPAEVQTKVKQLDTLLPQVTTLVNSLKGYQGTDLTNVVSKVQTDLGSAQKLYGEVRGMLPANLSAMLPKI